MEVHWMKVMNNVREIRESRGITQVQMAKNLQVTRQTINAIEKHKYNPSLLLALKIIAYFHLPIGDVFVLKEVDK